ncbi:ABC transporter ATP-binding protein [Acetobacteraceae bacterium H6797]|nr:ABC transporter ATP-binding protein [Acetobacteraceae bacterium H6797]
MSERGFLLEGLTAGYAGREVLRGFTLPETLAPGTLLALIGANGAGKSTLLRAVAGLGKSKGRIEMDGVALPGLKPLARARMVGYLPQTLPPPTPLVAYEAVLSACRAVRGDLDAAGAEAAIARAFDGLGIGHLALRRMDQLSGGQRQMVGLAQVLVREPGLLLLDEPTSALDLRWQLSVLGAVREAVQRSGSVAILAMHDINLALRLCDQVAVLAEGQVLACGEPAEVVSAEVLARAFGVVARVERCSQGAPVLLVDGAIESGDRL